MKVERLVRALGVAALLSVAACPRARADDAPPAAPPVAPIAPVEPEKPPASPSSEDPFAALTKRKPVPAPAWRDATIVGVRFREAVEAVETACGAKFEVRPTVRISTAAEVRRVLEAEFERLPASLGLKDVPPLVLEAMTGALTAKYDLAGHVVHVVPDNVEQCSAFAGVDLGTEDVLRVALAHECTHALDFRRFGWVAARETLTDETAFKAFGAVVEGHAQFVAKRVAEQWRLSDAFDTFTKAIGATPEDAPEYMKPMLRAMVSEVTFGYWQGAAFFEAVLAGAGEDGVRRALEHPPKTTREIERPAEWLRPSAAVAGVDLSPAFASLEALVPSPAWTPRRADLLEGTVRGQFGDLPPEEVAAVFSGFQEAKAFVASRTASTEMFLVLGMRFSTPEQAKALAGLDRRASEAKDVKMKSGVVRVVEANYADGAGTDGKWGGCTVTKVVAAGPAKIRATTAAFAAGTYAFEVSVSGRDVERAWIDRVVDALAAYVTDAARPLPTWPADAALTAQVEPWGVDLDDGRSVPMKLVGPDGRPVPRARVAVKYQRSESSYVELELAFKNGAVEIPQAARKAALLFYGATDDAGKTLDLGPRHAADVDLGAGELQFELPAGRTVEGRVVDASGRGVGGAEVRARDVEPIEPGPGRTWSAVISTARTDAGGRYRLTGLGDRTQIGFEPPPPLVAPNSIVFEGAGTVPDVVVSEGASAVVTVVDADAKPVAGASVKWARLEHPEPGTTVYVWAGEPVLTDASGRATLSGIPRGSESGLSVDPPQGDERFGSFNDVHWDGRDVEVSLARAQRIRGRVVDRTGKPASDASVHLKAPSGVRMTRRVATDGTFTFDGVEPGTVYVGATREERRASEFPGVEAEPPRWIEVVPGSPVEIVLADAPVTVAVTIRDLAPGRTVYVRADGDDSTTRELKAAAGGVVRVPGVAVGSRFDVYVPPTVADPRGVAASGVGSSAEGVTLDLVACVPTKGTLRAPTTYRYLEVSVVVPWGVIPVEVAPDGAFALPPLPPSRYTLRAKARGPEAWLYARAEFEPGSAVTLELRPK